MVLARNWIYFQWVFWLTTYRFSYREGYARKGPWCAMSLSEVDKIEKVNGPLRSSCVVLLISESFP